MVMVSNLEEEILWKGVNLGINVIILVVPLCKYKSSCILNNNDASDSTEITVCNCIRLQEVEFSALALLSTRRPYNYCSNSFPTRRPTTVHRYRSHSLSDCLRIPLQLNWRTRDRNWICISGNSSFHSRLSTSSSSPASLPLFLPFEHNTYHHDYTYWHHHYLKFIILFMGVRIPFHPCPHRSTGHVQNKTPKENTLDTLRSDSEHIPPPQHPVLWLGHNNVARCRLRPFTLLLLLPYRRATPPSTAATKRLGVVVIAL